MTVFIRKKKLWISLSVILATVIALVAVCAVYLGDYYRADTDALETFAPVNPVICDIWDDGTVVTRPDGREAIAGFVFYPGGKVAHTAYLPLMETLASEGILCVLVEMPFRLAVLDVNAADGVREAFPETVIEGGNHAYFGMYGEQKGDGTATMTPAEQVKQTADAILSMMEVSHED